MSNRVTQVKAVRLLVICAELMLSCACAALLTPLEGQCWRRTATPLQMVATGALGVVNIGRLVTVIRDIKLPVCIERIYLLLSAVLFAASGVRALSSERGTSGLEQEWDSHEVQRTALAFCTMALLIAEVTVSGQRTSRGGDDTATSPMLLPSVLDFQSVTAEKPPPSYAVVMGHLAREQEAN